MENIDISIKRATTYGFLALIRNSMKLINSTIDVFIPLVKKGMVKYCQMNKGVGDESISRIGAIINEEYAIEIPFSVLLELLKRIEKEVNDEGLFKIHKDNSFLLNSFTFLDFEEELSQAVSDARLIQRVYDDFCDIYEVDKNESPTVIDFIDNNRLVLSSYISNKREQTSTDYTIPAQFVEFCKQIPLIYNLLCNQFLGSIITCYLEFKPQDVKMNVDLLLDTNFIVSLLDLNTEESTKTCHKLMDISRSLGYTFHTMKDTIEETQSLLGHKSKNYDSAVIYKFINREDIYSACERRGLNGVDLERISDNLEKKLQEWGVQIIYNTDNLTGKARFSNEYSLLKSKRNTDKAALHDAKAIYYVKMKRGKVVNTFEDVNCWFVNNSITHDSDSDSIDALLNENRTKGLPEIIKADELLNILWLSNPQINAELANNEVSDIGLTSLVSFTLNKTLPKSSVIRKLDDNIQKYRTEDVTDRDVLMLSTRIINHGLNSEQVEQLNEMSNKDREEFSRRIREEAAKEEAEQKARGERLNKVITTWDINIKNIGKGEIKVTQTVIDQNKALMEENAAKDEEIRRLREEKLARENEKRKNLRDKYVKKRVRKWRRWPLIILISTLLLFIVGLIWIIFVLCNAPDGERTVASTWIDSKWFSIAFTLLMAIINGIIIKAFYERFFSQTHINSFKDHLDIPDELKDLTL